MGGRRGSNPRPSEPQSNGTNQITNEIVGISDAPPTVAPTVAPATDNQSHFLASNDQTECDQLTELANIFEASNGPIRDAILATARMLVNLSIEHGGK